MNLRLSRRRALIVAYATAFFVGLAGGGVIHPTEPPVTPTIVFDDPVPGAPEWPGRAREWIAYHEEHPPTGTESTATSLGDCMRQALATGGPCTVRDPSQTGMDDESGEEGSPTDLADVNLQELVEDMLAPSGVHDQDVLGDQGEKQSR